MYSFKIRKRPYQRGPCGAHFINTDQVRYYFKKHTGENKPMKYLWQEILKRLNV